MIWRPIPLSLTSRSPFARPASDSHRGKTLAAADDCCLVSDDAPNGSWTDSVDMAAAAFLCFGCRGAHGRPAAAKSARAVRTAQRVGVQPPAPAPTQCEAGNRLERHFRGEFRLRVFVGRGASGDSCRATGVAGISYYSPRLRESAERKSISGAQRRRLSPDTLCSPGLTLSTQLTHCATALHHRCHRWNDR